MIVLIKFALGSVGGFLVGWNLRPNTTATVLGLLGLALAMVGMSL